MSARKRKIELSSSSDEDQAVEKTDRRRHSERIQRQRQRPRFHLPSRHKVWDTIPSETSEDKYLRPRKSLNNFTKVYNTYNFDDYEDDSADDIENFLTDRSDSSNDSRPTLSDDAKKTSSARIKNYHRRIKVESSTSDEESNSQEKSVNGKKKIETQALDANNEEDTKFHCEEKTSKNASADEENDKSEAAFQHICFEQVDSGSDEVTPTKRKRNVSVLVSDSDDDKTDNVNNEEDTKIHCEEKTSKNSLADEENLDKSEAAFQHICFEEDDSGSDEVTPTKRRRNVSVLVSDSDDDKTKADNAEDAKATAASNLTGDHGNILSSGDNCSESSESSESESENESRAARLKRKSKELFQQFKDIQEKRKQSFNSVCD